MSLNTWQTATGKIIQLEIGPIFGGIEIGHTHTHKVMFAEKIVQKFFFECWDANIGESL